METSGSKSVAVVGIACIQEKFSLLLWGDEFTMNNGLAFVVMFRSRALSFCEGQLYLDHFLF